MDAGHLSNPHLKEGVQGETAPVAGGEENLQKWKLTVEANFVMNIWAGLVFVMNSCLEDGVHGEAAVVLCDGLDVALPVAGGEENLQKWKIDRRSQLCHEYLGRACICHEFLPGGRCAWRGSCGPL